jgi:hypothetical protein
MTADLNPEDALALEKAAATARKSVRDEAHRARQLILSDAQVAREIEQAERLTRLETQLAQLSEEIKRYVDADLEAHAELLSKVVAQSGKIDGLLELKAKGMGALWLASAVLGTGVLGIIYAVISYFRS